jgi:hypothetical protein
VSNIGGSAHFKHPVLWSTIKQITPTGTERPQQISSHSAFHILSVFLSCSLKIPLYSLADDSFVIVQKKLNEQYPHHKDFRK